MDCEIITIGDEILIGQIVDTNSAWLGQQLNAIGINVAAKHAISDTESAIIQHINLAVQHAPLVIITGGLGPTNDDITKKTLVKYFNDTLIRNTAIETQLVQWFKARGRELSDVNRQQADLPSKAEILPNKMGTASGMWFTTEKGCNVIALPGVPYEMKHIMNDVCIPLFKQRFNLPYIIHKTIMVSGMVESMIAEKIRNIEQALPSYIKLAYLPKPGLVRLRLTAKSTNITILTAAIEKYTDEISTELKGYVYGYDELAITQCIQQILLQKQATLATAESCTGGYISHLITQNSGSSMVFNGSIVCYTNKVKTTILGVSTDILEQHTAYSVACVESMLQGLKNVLNADYGIAISGVAGPDGGSALTPVGTVFIGVYSPNETKVQSFNFGDNRALIIERAAMHSLHILWKMLIK